jgi:hypothetical protein
MRLELLGSSFSDNTYLNEDGDSVALAFRIDEDSCGITRSSGPNKPYQPRPRGLGLAWGGLAW